MKPILNFHFHPKITLAATVLGASSGAATAIAVAAAISPLSTVHGLEKVQPMLLTAIEYLGCFSAVCNTIAGVGKSFLPGAQQGESH